MRTSRIDGRHPTGDRGHSRWGYRSVPALLGLLIGLLAAQPVRAQDSGSRQLRLEVGRVEIHDEPLLRGDRPSGLALAAHLGRRLSSVFTLDLGLRHGGGSEVVAQGPDPDRELSRLFNFTAFELALEGRLLPEHSVTPVLAAGAGIMQEYSFSTASLTYFASVGIEISLAGGDALRLTVRRGAHPNLGDRVTARGPDLVALSWVRRF